MSVSLDDLQLLLDVVACGSFSQAAARRGWSQPQVSQRIAVLEADYGVQLFRRHRRGAVATEACATLLPSLREALATLQTGRQALHGTSALPRLTLACIPSLASVVFAPLLPALSEAGFEIRCNADHSPVIMERLLSGKVDVGFVLKCPPLAGIQMERICCSPIVAVVARDHALAGAGRLLMAELANERLMPQSFGDGSDELLALIRSHRRSSAPIHMALPSSAVRELALEFGYLSFVPEMAVKRDLRAGTLIKLDVPDLPRWEWEVMMAWRAGKRPAPEKQQVLDTVRGMAGEWG
jgi:DNA-binding transcriptional LysR family regulator